MRGKSLMVMGTASSVGKSVLCSAFLRIIQGCAVQSAEHGIKFVRHQGRLGNGACAGDTGAGSGR